MAEKIKRYCKHCGMIYFGHKSKVYCSPKCRRTHYRPPWNKGLKGLPANRPKNGEYINCKHCGKRFYLPKCYLGKRFYCSKECYYKERWKNHKGMIAKECKICGSIFYDYASNSKKTCGRKCSSELRSQNQEGEKSHFWRGGKMVPYHKGWRKARRKALERDNFRCTLCGSAESPIVHHIIPYRYSKTHDLNNLITLCRTCHGSEEYKVNAKVRKELAAGRCASQPKISV